MRKVLNIAVPVILCFLIGYIASIFQAPALEGWYPYLNKPSLIPPNSVFPIAWGILYVLMGVSIGLILNSNDEARKSNYLAIFLVQLFFNFTWSIMFFYMQNPLLGLINIIILDIVVIYYIAKTWTPHRVSSILFIPYILWLCFATYLNAYILMYN